MASGSRVDSKDSQKPVVPRDAMGGQRSFRVVLEGIRAEIETIDSFAIKFSILTKTPLSKIKHLAGNLPASIWSGAGRSRAEHVLALLEEAGGSGKIIDIGADAPVKSAAMEPANRPTCGWCGFPLKDGDTHCGFCRTPVGGPIATEEPRPEAVKRARSISSKRLFWYALIIVVEIIVLAIAR